MKTIRRKLVFLIVTASIFAILLIMLFVNITIGNKFNEYLVDTQNKRYERLISYFQEIYKRDGKWNKNSGIEMIHEAYMGNYCLTLLDTNKKLVWGMSPDDIKNKLHIKNMSVQNRGVYTSRRFKIRVNNKIVGYIDIGQYSPVLLSEDDINFKTSVNKSILVSGIVTLVIILIISIYFSKQFAAPIKEVANMSVSLSKGDFNIKYGTKSNIKELEDLRKSVNILAEKLEFQDSLRRRLVSDISHEIRTPLNVLQNNLEAMIDGLFPVTQDRLNYLNDEVVRFGKLLNNLNVLKEFENESMKLNFETIALDKFAKDVCEDFQMSAEDKNIKLKWNIEPDVNYSIVGDRDRLKQVLINLISNALKFTEAGGEIQVSLYNENKNVILEVKDTGIGIKKEDLPFIFERLYRGDKSRHQTEGSGIGLTIAKNILQLHNASIEVDSEFGKGSTFRIIF